jgi:hypothetical protein
MQQVAGCPIAAVWIQEMDSIVIIVEYYSNNNNTYTIVKRKKGE